MPLPKYLGDCADTSVRVLELPISALCITARDAVGVADGLPAGALQINDRRLILAATPCDPPLFTTIDLIARRRQRDILLVRTGFFPETLDPVTVDVALGVADEVMMLTGMIFCRAIDGRLWLVGRQTSPAIEITPNGLLLEMASPFGDGYDRMEAACRAATEIVRMSARGAR